ncbi:uncharacterized protein F4822DRAFT_137519 [Hypoxylon trugodes]|uniref:uncharacterized protein n=1 Tax=Hypoxylon trugodes TaxID=326681 RepID=UPI00219B2579|nr:uncharacterized protein F4822DRAFT_137519 [Hypoxylon trugodes]KAI1392674.1 hypothetical protein F4822DRAFT_137519 [Hypoxylon trugodes]
MSSKEAEARGDALPSYEDASGPSSFAHIGQEDAPMQGPSLASPFNFPSDSNLPSYTASPTTTEQQRPIAIPQLKPDFTSPFLDAYTQILLRHGVTEDTWVAFLRTLSGFLAATVSEKAISHAAEIGQHIGDVPKRFGKETLAHIKHTGHNISDSAKKGNYIGAATRVVGGAIALPVATAIRAAGAVVSLPFAAIGAVTKDPKTPRERAVAYAAAANVKWLHSRGLEAHLLDTAELGHNLGLPLNELLQLGRANKDADAAGKLALLGTHIAELKVRMAANLEIGANTLWLVVMEKAVDDVHDDKDKGKHKSRK